MFLPLKLQVKKIYLYAKNEFETKWHLGIAELDVSKIVPSKKKCMKVVLAGIGKTSEEFIKTGISLYESRIKHYHPFESVFLPDLKNAKSLPLEMQKQKEGEMLLKLLLPNDFVVLLDENGQSMDSLAFSRFLGQQFVSASRRLVFIIGGPYGFSDEVYKKAGSRLSLSAMTFSHQIIRLVFLEQLYRANTILKGEPYHHA